MIADVADLLADPVDLSDLTLEGTTLRTVSGAYYDIAPEGYVTLAGGLGLRYGGDNSQMIQARETFLSRGHFAPFVEAVTSTVQDVLDDAGVPDDCQPALLEVGAGTGYYLSHMLDAVEGARGIGLDVSIPAAKRLASCHPRVGAVIADAWAKLPVKSNSIDAIAVVFAPRNASEFARVLKPRGEVVVLTADTGHLDELREPLGIIGVEPGKAERMIAQASGHLRPVGEPETVEFRMSLNQESIASQIGMSPSARHIHPDILSERIARLPQNMEVTARGTITRLAKV